MANQKNELDEKLPLLDSVDAELEEEKEGEEDDEDVEDTEAERKKRERISREKEQLVSRILSDDHAHLITRVAHVLNRDDASRNSDIALMLRYWEAYHKDEYKVGEPITPKMLFEFERLTSITRARAKIQNEYKLFQADDKIRHYRRSQEEVQREIELSTKPVSPTISIFCDETGKNKDYLIVGSVWVLELGQESMMRSRINEWKKDQGLSITDEFHFTKLSRNNLDIYKAFFDFVLSIGGMISFKAIMIKKTELARGRATDDVLAELHYQLVRQGIDHEVNDSGRVALPRKINFWKDKEDGNDALTITKIQENLHTQFKVHYEDELKLNMLMAVESNLNHFIQLADLFAASLNRVLNENNVGNQKDQLALHILERLGVDPSNVFANSNDMVKIIDLHLE